MNSPKPNKRTSYSDSSFLADVGHPADDIHYEYMIVEVESTALNDVFDQLFENVHHQLSSVAIDDEHDYNR